MSRTTSRRSLLRAGAGAAGCAAVLPAFGRFSPMEKVNVLSIGVVGSIGGTDRKQVAAHPAVRIAGLCDVDDGYLQQAAAEHPDAFTCKDWRQAFAEHADEFDAVIVSVPDHSHAPVMLTALAHGKHVYGQKPLVHQLAELAMIDAAMAARPGLVTQVGNQRMVYPGRRAAVEILRSGVLGAAVEAHAWTGSPSGTYYFNIDRVLSEPQEPPPGLDWNLWLGPCPEAPYRDLLVPLKWRSWWDYGTGGLGDWGVHVLDVIFFAYDELTSPIAVVTHAPEPAGVFHPYPCRATVTYAVDSPRFARRFFPIHYSDRNQAPSRAALGLPAGAWSEENMTVVVCEGGVLVLSAGGRLEIWRQGERTDGLQMPGLPEFPELNHWHAWVDNIVGKKTELRTPFPDGVRITEAALLAVKATRFPGQELRWDRASLSFTNHEEATQTIVRREYREGFAPPTVA
ncbi:MAG: gfo/Idh/MocA family oxidoreductase [Planctomycetota bacterium]|nr:MAG: gfo/Idh/MocA family oxidoreductase [Planctomycetota bacterium]